MQGFVNLDEFTIEYPRVEDQKKMVISRQVISKKDAAAILLYDPVKKTFILAEQLRLPAHLNLFENQENGVLTEIIAGNLEIGETATQTAIREVREESGFLLEDVEKITSVFSSPGYSTEQIHLFFAEITEEIREKRISKNLDKSEDIRIVEWSLEQARTKMENGEIPDMKTQLAFRWFFAMSIKSKYE